jgi:hypothetical protein
MFDPVFVIVMGICIAFSVFMSWPRKAIARNARRKRREAKKEARLQRVRNMRNKRS